MKPSELNILVVEDDDFQRGMLVKMLSFFGILSIADVGDGKQALEKIRGENAKPVDIVSYFRNATERFLREMLHG